ncbi:MAG: bifunctional aspartate transaminase/aspartate 4-decarboxylase, partial [Coriobacteriales bacterium]|nr:bifunctional aspartate transaminase/aspartate 4-decarboxylase [Coriobacteriales bacterium]
MKKKITSIIVSIALAFCLLPGTALLSACSSGESNNNSSTAFNKQLNKEKSAFEITAAHREAAKNNSDGKPVLDAGRGNPNWINTQARYAFTRFSDFAVSESERNWKDGDMAGQAELDGIGERFSAAMNSNDATDAFLIKAINYCTNTLGLNKDALIKELVDACVGDYYPSPSRCLENTEKILNAYLQSTLYAGENLADQTQVFPTEGGSAAICYIFESLTHNKVLNPEDKIAIATPIFTPYLEIPNVNAYDLFAIDVSTSAEDNWDINDENLKKLEDPAVKAFFLVNPSNPASHALSSDTLAKLKEVVKKNPNLIIITDDVYGTFVNDFQTVYSVVPANTLLVYSFSKLYGVTGWRVGLIAMNKDNVVDKMIAGLSRTDKDYLHDEYISVTEEPEKLSFVERMVADSRSIGLYHTSGLSTPQQAFMDFLALTHLVCESNDPYIDLANSVVNERYVAFMTALGLEADEDELDSQYYALLDVNKIVTNLYGEDFVNWLNDNKSDLD